VIRSFADEATEAIWNRKPPAKFRPIAQLALRKLRMLEHAQNLLDVKVPPNNRLEKLRGDRAGQFSIRINDRYRVCFTWENNAAHHVEITDYH